MTKRARDTGRRRDARKGLLGTPFGVLFATQEPPNGHRGEPRRLSVDLDEERYREFQEIFREHGLSFADAARTGLAVMAFALPYLKDGADLLVHEQSGAQHAFVFFGGPIGQLTKSKPEEQKVLAANEAGAAQG